MQCHQLSPLSSGSDPLPSCWGPSTQCQWDTRASHSLPQTPIRFLDLPLISKKQDQRSTAVPRYPLYQLVMQYPRCGQNMATLLPKHGPHRVLQMSSSWILINVPRDAPCQISLFWLNSVAPFPRVGQNMALLWAKHGSHMVLQVGSSWILVSVPGDVPCQISNCWVYPVAPFPRNGQNMVLTWSFKLVLPES